MSAQLSQQLHAVGMHYVAEHLDDVIALATKHRWGAHLEGHRLLAEPPRGLLPFPR